MSPRRATCEESEYAGISSGGSFFLCIFAPFTFVIFLIDAIKKVVSGDGNEYFPGLGAGLSLFIMLGGIFYVLL